MTDVSLKSTVSVLETQPLTVEGVKALLDGCPDLEFAGSAGTLHAGIEMVQELHPSLVLADKALGIQGLVQWLVSLRPNGSAMAVVVWGISLSEAEALRLIQAGARGVIRKTADPGTLMKCLRTVASGSVWLEDSIFRQSQRVVHRSHSELTPREQQVFDLVGQGLKNGEIAQELGIRPGTVKIHLKHIFEKTGVRGRYGLALSGLTEKGLLARIA